MSTNDRQTRRFSECALLIRERLVPADAPELPYVGLEHVGEGTLRLLGTGSCVEVTSAGFRFRPGDILFGRLRPYFRKVVRARIEGVCSGEFWVVRPADGIDGGFLFYWMATPNFVDTATRGSEGTKMPRAKWEFVGRTTLPIPPLDEQRLIGAVLASLDDKIELNRRIAATAHELAHAIFRSRHRSDEPDLPHEPLGEHLEVTRGLGYTGAGLADEGIPLHNLDSIRAGGGYSRDGIKHYTGDYAARHLVRPGDVIVASVDLTWNFRVVASPARVPARFGESLFSQDLFAVRPRRGSMLTRAFIYLMLLPGRLRSEIAGYANGTTVNRIPLEALRKPKFAVPARSLVEEIDALVTPLFDRAEAAEDESETLAQLRDTLLPKLISGELRIRDSEAAVESAPRSGRSQATVPSRGEEGNAE